MSHFISSFIFTNTAHFYSYSLSVLSSYFSKSVSQCSVPPYFLSLAQYHSDNRYSFASCFQSSSSTYIIYHDHPYDSIHTEDKQSCGHKNLPSPTSTPTPFTQFPAFPHLLNSICKKRSLLSLVFSSHPHSTLL